MAIPSNLSGLVLIGILSRKSQKPLLKAHGEVKEKDLLAWRIGKGVGRCSFSTGVDTVAGNAWSGSASGPFSLQLLRSAMCYFNWVSSPFKETRCSYSTSFRFQPQILNVLI